MMRHTCIVDGRETSVYYLVRDEDDNISSEVMQMAMLLQQIQNKEIRRAAIEQVKVLANIG